MIYRNAIWRGEENLYDFKTLRVVHTFFQRENFADFQKLITSETDTRWEAIETIPGGLGVDESKLESLIPEPKP